MKYFLTRAHHSLNVDDFNFCIEATSATCERSTLSGDKSGHPRKLGRRKKTTFVKRLNDKLASPQHFATSGIHSLRCSLPRGHSVTEFGDIQTSSASSPAFYVSICLSRWSLGNTTWWICSERNENGDRESFEALVKN